MNRMFLSLGLTMFIAGVAGPAFAAHRVLVLENLPPIRPGVAAIPLIADPVDAAERTINGTLQRLNRSLRDAVADCLKDQAGQGHARRSVEVIQHGPSDLTFVVRDDLSCGPDDDAGPSVEAISYDLSTGAPVDWQKRLPSSLRGTNSGVSVQRDGTELDVVESKELYALYRAAYRLKPTRQTGNLDDADCRQVITKTDKRYPPGMIVWPDAKRGGLVLKFDMQMQAFKVCADEVIIPAAVLRARGASSALLEAMGAERAHAD